MSGKERRGRRAERERERETGVGVQRETGIDRVANLIKGLQLVYFGRRCGDVIKSSKPTFGVLRKADRKVQGNQEKDLAYLGGVNSSRHSP